MEQSSNYRKQIMELQIKLNKKECLILEQRNVVLEKQLRIEDLELQVYELKKKHIEPHQEFLNTNIKPLEIKLADKKECGDCRREDRRMFSTPGYKCESEDCCNYK